MCAERDTCFSGLCYSVIIDLSALTADLQALPLHSDTLRVHQKKAQLEAKLSDIEDAIKIFSKPRVFIKVDD